MNKKMLRQKPCGHSKNAYDCVKEELKVLKRLEHPNIIWLHEIIDDPNKENIYLVTEFHSRGSLGDKISKLNRLNEAHNRLCIKEDRPTDMKSHGLKPTDVRMYFIDMLKALHYCHQEIGVIHRDIKPDNIMINHNNEAVLIDFGMSALVKETDKSLMEKNLGSYMFFAPEMFESYKTGTDYAKRGEKTDLWALGITFYYLLCGRYPCCDAKNPYQLQELVRNRPVNFDLIK